MMLEKQGQWHQSAGQLPVLERSDKRSCDDFAFSAPHALGFSPCPHYRLYDQ